MSCVHTMSSGGMPPAMARRNGCSNRAKWITVGAGWSARRAASSLSSRHATSASTPSRSMDDERPVIRATAGGIVTPCGSAMSCERGWTVVLDRDHAISRRWPRGAAAVAWQSITSTSSSESGAAQASPIAMSSNPRDSQAPRVRRVAVTSTAPSTCASSVSRRDWRRRHHTSAVSGEQSAGATWLALVPGSPVRFPAQSHPSTRCSAGPRRRALRPRRPMRPSPPPSAARRTAREN